MGADLDLALRLADAADEIALSRFRARDLVVETKPDRTPVTEADRAVETELRTILGLERRRDATRRDAVVLFHYSLAYLALLFVAAAIDPLIL